MPAPPENWFVATLVNKRIVIRMTAIAAAWAIVALPAWGALQSCHAPPLPSPRPATPSFIAPSTGPSRDTPPRVQRARGEDPASTFVVLLVEFQPDDDPETTGDGRFALEPAYPDSIPHDRAYFRRQMDHLEHYWRAASGGAFELDVVIAPASYTLPHEMAHYGEDDEVSRRVAELLRDAINAADDDVDFGQYSGVIVLHAGAGQESDAAFDTPNDIWSAFVPRINMEEELGLPEGIPTDDLDTDGDTLYIDIGVIVPETENQDLQEGETAGILAGLGVLAHETGHLLGLPDLFDAGAGPTDTWGIGAWGIMGLGAWNAGGFSPALPCAWTLSRLGWVTETTLAPGDTFSMLPTEGEGGAGELARVAIGPEERFLLGYRVGDIDGDGCFSFNDPNSDGLLEYFDPASEDSYLGAEFDFFLPFGDGLPCGGSGMGTLLWHVDETVVSAGAALDVNLVNDVPLRKGVDLEQAGGIQDLDMYPGSWGKPSDAWVSGSIFGTTSSPSSQANDGGHTGLRIEFIDNGLGFSKVAIGSDQYGAGWPASLPGTKGATGDVLLVDFDNDGRDEICVQADDGTPYLVSVDDGAPVVRLIGGEKSGGAAGMAAGPLNEDGFPELAVLQADGRLEVFDMSVPDSPDTLWTRDFPRALAPPVVDRIRGSSGVLVCVEAGLGAEVRWMGANGELVESWVFDEPITQAPAIASDGRIAVVVGSREVHLAEVESQEPGTFTILEGNISSPPVFIDVLGESNERLVVVEGEGRAHLLGGDLSDGEKWPIDVTGRLDAPPLALDLPGGAPLDLIAAGSDPSQLYRWDGEGAGILDWPDPAIGLGQGVRITIASPLAGDLDGNDRADIIVVDGEGVIDAIDLGPTGTSPRTIADFPRQLPSRPAGAPALGDVDGDGRVDLVAVDQAGRIHLWEHAGSADEAPWPQAGGGPGRASRYQGPDPSDSGIETKGLLASDLVFAYPNPAPASPTIHYRLGNGVEWLEIRILDVRGEELEHVLLRGMEEISPGDHRWQWSGASVRGVYLAVVTAGAGGTVERKTVRLAILGGTS